MRILLAQTSFLGDVILSTPVVAAIRSFHPNCEIWMMTTPLAADLVKRDPFLKKVIPFAKRGSDAGWRGLWGKSKELRALKFDRVYSLHRSFRTALLLRFARIPERYGFTNAKLSWLYTNLCSRDQELHDVKRNLQILDRPIGPELEELRLFAPTDDEVSPDLLALPHRGQWVAMVPGSVWLTKRWHWEHFRSTAQVLRDQGRTVLLLGSEQERELCERVAEGSGAIDLAGKLSLSEMMWVVKNAALMICNDSMALHMASAFKVPTTAIFCATSPSFGFGPWKNAAVVVERTGLSCKPCTRHGSQTCPVKTEACMREVLPAQVLEAAQKLLDGGRV